jgi:2-methylcitrate dehydratase PrpD
MHKRYLVGSPNQTYLQGVFSLLQQHALRADDIAAIEVQIPARGLKRVPTTRHASISAPNVCAIAAAHGKLDFYKLHDPAGAMDDAARAIQQRVRFVGRDDWTDLDAGRRAIVTIKTHAGARHTENVTHTPMTRDELTDKFNAQVDVRFGAARSTALARDLQNLPSAASVRPLMQVLAAH